MAGISAVGSVGAGLSQARFQAEYQVRVLKEQQSVTQDLGNAALKLIKAALSTGPAQNDLDLVA